jgi:hypothetical protein
VTQEVTLFKDMGGQLHWTGQLVSVNQDYEAVWRNRPTSLIQSDPFNGMDLFGVVSPTESFTATSLEAALPQATLRSSIDLIPSTARFLRFLNSVPERVLSRRI